MKGCFISFAGLSRGLLCKGGFSRGAKVVGILRSAWPGAVLCCNIMACG